MSCLAFFLVLPAALASSAKSPTHTFRLGTNDFLLDGRPFQIRSGEIHPSRIPREYWRHRIQMAKAMGLNTISAYIFWDYHELEEGRFDFKTGNRDLAGFFRIAQQEGMWGFCGPDPIAARSMILEPSRLSSCAIPI